MESEFRLLKQKNGCHFARVTVIAQPTASGVSVIEDIREPIDEGNAEVNRKLYPAWIDAAIEGARKCAGKLVTSGQVAGCEVRVTRVMGVIVDTTEEDVICAAALATWQALMPDVPVPAHSYDGNRWVIDF